MGTVPGVLPWNQEAQSRLSASLGFQEGEGVEGPLPETVSSCPDVLVTWDQATRLTPWTVGPEDTTAWTLQGTPFLVSGSKSSPRHPAIKTFLRDSKEKRPDSSQIHACESDPHH